MSTPVQELGHNLKFSVICIRKSYEKDGRLARSRTCAEHAQPLDNIIYIIFTESVQKITALLTLRTFLAIVFGFH